nr:uncharacterized protein LOC111517210 isoform X1 [Leptinotarsa decemlineata]
MDLSTSNQNSPNHLQFLKSCNKSSSPNTSCFLVEQDVNENSANHLQFLKSSSRSVSPNTSFFLAEHDVDIIEADQINFGNDESWLCSVPNSQEENISNLGEWLKGSEINDDFLLDIAPKTSQAVSQKLVDSRTFTRPKKRFTRPSIEQYNEEMYGSGSEISVGSLIKRKSMNRPLSESFVIQERMEVTPVEFDLSQPSSSYYFDKISSETGEADSFQNMSPPSLVNSMCSSTFANLMESSFIKNDPVLREIRDTDFTESVLLQDCEPPMFQSITESCSSISSDTPENFLKKMSFNGTFRKNATKDLDKTVSLKMTESDISQDTTYENSSELVSDVEQIDMTDSTGNSLKEPSNEPSYTLNGTYRRTPKKSNTFRRSDRNKTIVLNSTIDIPQIDNSTLNSTQTLIEESSVNSFKTSESFSNTLIKNDTIEDMKKQLSDDVKIKTDLNRLSYCNENDNLNSTFNKDMNSSNKSGNLKQSPLGCSIGSADSLDRMSSSMSSSSRGSNKMLNMAEVDAIVEMQERSLHQVMSTPKPNATKKKIWENNFISPIITTEQISDSEFSSNDDYKSVRSSVSKTSLDNQSSKNTKSLGNLVAPVVPKGKLSRRTSYTIADQKPLQTMPSVVRNSYSNLKYMQTNIHGSQSNLQRPSSIRMPSSNLKTMGPKLKGSYTSLRPMSANLPVAPPPINQNLNSTMVLPKASNPNVTQVLETRPKVVEVLPMPREKVNIVGDSTFIKPHPPRTSGLPRPTGIPRPASRIPGPRSNNIRPTSARSGNNL